MNPWAKVKHLFEEDDGSLPDIYVDAISPEQTVAIYEWLMGQCKILGEPTLWSIEQQQDVPIRAVSGAARAFIQGRVEGFRHGLTELSISGIPLPDLTVCVDTGGISFDYRMGADWNEQKVLALFNLLRQVRQLAPQAQIKQASEGRYSHPNGEFTEAFEAYIFQVGH